jgi:hypothetical protein
MRITVLFALLSVFFSPLDAKSKPVKFSKPAEQIQPTLSAKEESLIGHVKQSIALAEQGVSKLDRQVFEIHGMSSPKVRHLLNNLCSLPRTTYLEIGCWKGSTFVAALYRNNPSIANAFAVENWSEFGGPRDEFLRNVATFLPMAPIHISETDCFALDKANTFHNPVTIYFYDGAHDEGAQARAFTYYREVFDDVFIAIVDDWNWGNVRAGTVRGLRESEFEVLFDRELLTNSNGDMDSWWNGLYVAVVRKKHPTPCASCR